MKINNLPLVSVVMSTYNDKNTVKKAIDSILNQTYKKTPDQTASMVRLP